MYIIYIFSRSIRPDPFLYRNIASAVESDESRKQFYSIIKSQLQNFVIKEYIKTHTPFYTPIYLIHKHFPKLFNKPSRISDRLEVPITQDVLYDDETKKYKIVHDDRHENHSLHNLVRIQWIPHNNIDDIEIKKSGIFYSPPSKYMDLIIKSLFGNLNKHSAYKLHRFFQCRHNLEDLEKLVLADPEINKILDESDNVLLYYIIEKKNIK